MKNGKTTLGWERLSTALRSSRRLDDVQKTVAARAISRLMHAHRVGDLKAFDSAFEALARVFLKFDVKSDD